MMNDNLFDKIGSTVFETDMTRKITLDGNTSALKVYKIKLSELFYNDKNDRIATSIDSYNRNHETPLSPGKNEDYNKVIENFIVKSNEQAIFKTKNNIRLVGQREAGVVLPDGRVIDGNRRFTCLRQLASEAEKFTYFEAIILPKDADAKQIKLLELMIQHGEEQRVEYDPIDMIVGMYHDIVETEMLTVAEYAKAIDVMEREVEVKLKMAEIFVDFLDFINMPKHWYIIKEFGIYNGVSGTGHSTTLETILRRCDEKYKNDLKTILYTNIVLNTSGKLVDIVSKLISSDLIVQYVRHTRNLANDFKEQLDTVPYSNMDELRTLINMNGDIKQELTQLLDESFLKHKKNEVHSQPSKNVSKAISMIKTIDEGVIDKLTEKETADLKQNITKLTEQINKYSEKLDLPVIGIPNNQNEAIIPESNECLIKKNYTVDLKYIVPTVRISNCLINSLYKTLVFDVDFEFVGFFVDSNGRKVSNDFIVNKNAKTVDVELQSSISSEQQCFLMIKHPEAIETCISQVIPFKVSMMFVSKFDF